MKVRAIKMGFYEALRSVGDVFDVPDGETASWFVAVEDGKQIDDKPEPPAKKGKKKSDEGQDKPEDEQAPA